MSLVIDVPPDVERRLQVEAERQGMPIEQYARELLAQWRPATTPDVPFYERATSEEWSRAFHDLIDSFGDIQAPPIPLEALRRESMYDDLC